ncbi:CDP-glycerol glycerophosphotransferase family protein [Chloroflexota bacterium]
MKIKMVVFFAINAAEFNYLLPILKKLGGEFVTASKDLYNFVTSKYPSIRCHLGEIHNLSSYCPSVIVLAGNYGWFPSTKEVKLVQVFHGLSDKRSIYRKSNFKNPSGLLYLMSAFIELYLPSWSRKFSLMSDELWGPLKHLRLDRLMRNRFDLLCLVGKHMEEKFRELNLLTENNWEAVGFPRLDCVANNELSREDIFKDLNLDSSLMTVLYAPTWRGSQEMNLSSIPDMGLEILKSVDDNVNLIFKPHPNVKRLNEFPETLKEIERYIAKHPNFVYPCVMCDIIPLMYISDVLITDYSTVAIEYFAFNRPIIFLDHLREKYDDSNLVEVWIREAGEIVQNKNELRGAIKRSINNPSHKSEIRKEYRDYFFYPLDGRASERAANAIIQLEKSRSKLANEIPIIIA